MDYMDIIIIYYGDEYGYILYIIYIGSAEPATALSAALSAALCI